MVRLVFRPYTQIWRSICTSESLRASTRVSPGFTLFRHSSPSFGSQHICSHSDRSSEELRPVDCASRLRESSQEMLLSLRTWVYHPCTRIHVKLLGPCFKTGCRAPISWCTFCQPGYGETPSSHATKHHNAYRGHQLRSSSATSRLYTGALRFRFGNFRYFFNSHF